MFLSSELLRLRHQRCEAAGAYYQVMHVFAEASCARRPYSELQILAGALVRATEPYRAALEALRECLLTQVPTTEMQGEYQRTEKLLMLLAYERAAWSRYATRSQSDNSPAAPA